MRQIKQRQTVPAPAEFLQDFITLAESTISDAELFEAAKKGTLYQVMGLPKSAFDGGSTPSPYLKSGKHKSLTAEDMVTRLHLRQATATAASAVASRIVSPKFGRRATDRIQYEALVKSPAGVRRFDVIDAFAAPSERFEATA